MITTWINDFDKLIHDIIKGGGTNLNFPQNRLDDYIYQEVLAPEIDGYHDRPSKIQSKSHEMNIFLGEFIEKMDENGLYSWY